MGLSGLIHRVLDAIRELPGVRQYRMRAYDRKFASHTGSNLYRGVFPSFEAALDSAPPVKPVGYDNPQSARIYADRTQRILPSDYAALFWLQQLFAAGARRILDLGGNIGNSYYAFQRLVDYPEDLRWIIHDVPAVMEEGKVLAKSLDADRRLGFAECLEDIVPVDVMLAFGSLQFLPDTIDKLLRKLPAPPAHLLINRLPLHPSESFFSLQTIGSAFCPYRIEADSVFLESVRSLGYEMVDRWRVPELGCHIPFAPDYSLHGYTGCYFRLCDEVPAGSPTALS